MGFRSPRFRDLTKPRNQSNLRNADTSLEATVHNGGQRIVSTDSLSIIRYSFSREQIDETDEKGGCLLNRCRDSEDACDCEWPFNCELSSQYRL